MGPRLNKVVAPDMIAMPRSQPNAGAAVEPQPPSRLLPFGYFKPLTAPDPLDTITTNLPTSLAKKRVDPTIAVTPVLRRQRDNRSRQRFFISPDDGGVSLRPAWLADDPAGMAFRELPSSTAPRESRLHPRNHGSNAVSTKVLQHIRADSGLNSDISGRCCRTGSNGRSSG